MIVDKRVFSATNSRVIESQMMNLYSADDTVTNCAKSEEKCTLVIGPLWIWSSLTKVRVDNVRENSWMPVKMVKIDEAYPLNRY